MPVELEEDDCSCSDNGLEIPHMTQERLGPQRQVSHPTEPPAPLDKDAAECDTNHIADA
jgi:hypothetical protein